MPSMDIVSKPDAHEVTNAMEQAHKEIKTRFDFKGVDAAIDDIEGGYKLTANTEEKVKSIADVIEDKFIKRKLSIKFLERKTLKVTASILNDKKINESKVRVESKDIDYLQAVQSALRGKDLDVHLSFENYQR